jgi:hypothetical protein
MTTTSFGYDKSKPSGKENDHDVDVVEENELVNPINQLIGPLIPEFKDASGATKMTCNDWTLSRRN